MKTGRPRGSSKYSSDMDKVVEKEMANGASLIEVCVKIGITRETMMQWTNKDGPYFKESFSDAVSWGKQLSEAWWLKVGRENLENSAFQYKGWSMNMNNRFDWWEKKKVDHSGEVQGGHVVVQLPDNGR